MKSNVIPVVDLFAGPGGLGEGFTALNDGKSFKIIVSAEKDPVAHQTLKLRAFYRALKTQMPDRIGEYYAYCHGESSLPYTEATAHLWEDAGREALCIELGTPEGNLALDESIQKGLAEFPIDQPWVLIGGPPCQAYSLAGRSRNKGISNYIAENDKRNFLYKEYLRIINSYRPAMFVMENVKGMLSAKVNGKRIFDEIIQDLASPDRAFPEGTDHPRYVIHSLVKRTVFRAGDDPKNIKPSDFVIKAEEYGVPQARHRVILIGVREDFFDNTLPLLSPKPQVTVKDAIDALPPLRSKLSKEPDSQENWVKRIAEEVQPLLKEMYSKNDTGVATRLESAIKNLHRHKSTGSIRVARTDKATTGFEELDSWYKDDNLKVWLNHDTRGHRIDDLVRYAFAASFSRMHGRSPKGHKEFNYAGLAPAHQNWESGNFSDRFRVQLEESPATTITSHISKDGHYFIHYDPSQSRSLTVREAARLQTFPDNYFFQGNRTQQYHQVGNAVPPFLANMIAAIVSDYVKK